MNQNKKSKYFWENILFSLFRFLWFTISELWQGIRYDKIDVAKYLFPGTMLALFFVVRADYIVAWIFGADWLKASLPVREWLVYTNLFAGWIFWAGQRAYYRTKVLARLRSAFEYCSLTAQQKFPAFIEDVMIDDHVRRLKLFTRGIPLKKFLENKENLEGHLNFSVVKMYEEPNDKSRINIIYTMNSLPNIVHLENQDDYIDGEIPIGKSHEGIIHVNLRNMGHILVAGQTGGGKSNFLKVATTTLCQNNPEAEVYFLDFKGGMELADLKNSLGRDRENFIYKAGPSDCVKMLAQIGADIDKRLQGIAKLGVSNFDEYLKNYLLKPAINGEINKEEKLKRQFIVIDEIAQLYARDPGISKEDLLKAREAVNRIARQGRAAATHLIVATQKPDSSSFDQTVKSNLPAVLCFPMATQAASISAIGSKRAFDLNPDVKGRAVWKFGPRVAEVQTYVFE